MNTTLFVGKVALGDAEDMNSYGLVRSAGRFKRMIDLRVQTAGALQQFHSIFLVITGANCFPRVGRISNYV